MVKNLKIAIILIKVRGLFSFYEARYHNSLGSWRVHGKGQKRNKYLRSPLSPWETFV